MIRTVMKRALSVLVLLCGLAALGCGEEGSGADAENSADLCGDGTDNDGDGDADCDDAECTAFCVDSEPPEWRTTWVASQYLVGSDGMPPPIPGMPGSTFRQNIQISIGGEQLRFTFSNEYGEVPLTIVSAGVARSLGRGAIDEQSHIPLAFSGESSVTIEASEMATSDPVQWEVSPRADIAVSMLFDDSPPDRLTGHPGSRTTSNFEYGDAVSSPTVSGSSTVHWYFLSSVDVLTNAGSRAVAVLGNSITDGYGSTTDGDDRWPDNLSRRLLENPGTEHVAVLNQGIGGNCLVNSCLGPQGRDRFDRDVLNPLGVKWAIIFEGINDLAYFENLTAERFTNALAYLAERAHDKGLTVIGGTIMPCEGHSHYSEDMEVKRQEINEWIRTTDILDSFIDFDEITRDPSSPTRLSPYVDGGDALHPGPAGYQIMADAIDLALFEER